HRPKKVRDLHSDIGSRRGVLRRAGETKHQGGHMRGRIAGTMLTATVGLLLSAAVADQAAAQFRMPSFALPGAESRQQRPDRTPAKPVDHQRIIATAHASVQREPDKFVCAFERASALRESRNLNLRAAERARILLGTPALYQA